jgi:hypothetical protein
LDGEEKMKSRLANSHPVVSTTSKDELVVAESAGGVVGQMAGVQKRLNLPAGAGIAPVGVTASKLAQRRAFSSVGAGVGQDASVTKLVSARYFVIRLASFLTFSSDAAHNNNRVGNK